MNKKRKPTINPDILFNPFIEGESIKGKNSMTTTKMITRTSDGKTSEVDVITNSYDIEDQVYTRIYHDSEYRQFLMNCSGNAIKLYTFLTFKLVRNQDWIWINKIQFKKESGISEKNYEQAIYELERYGIIAYTVYKDTYYINPMIFFCGNRVNKFKDNVKLR